MKEWVSKRKGMKPPKMVFHVVAVTTDAYLEFVKPAGECLKLDDV